MSDAFRKFAERASHAVGSPAAFLLALAALLLWAATGPFLHFSDTWQLIINTSTTIVTFLMVFLIQNTQNRDARAMHLKLDELIRAHDKARNRLLDVEELSDGELEQLQRDYERLGRDMQTARNRRAKKRSEKDGPEAQPS